MWCLIDGGDFIRSTFIVANWKMNKLISEAHEFCREFLPLVEDVTRVNIAICPPFTCLDAVSKLLKNSKVSLGAQNLFWEEKGAYTGEVSASMLSDIGCRYVILGHSERRQILGETDSVINRKLQAAIRGELIPIFCVGETLQERENNMAMEVVKKQLSTGLKDVKVKPNGLVIAYEPVWAIGTGVNASSDDAQEMCGFIRNQLEKLYGNEIAQTTAILYGGSVKETNMGELLKEDDIDGALVGGASLDVSSFAGIVRIGENG